MVNGAGRNNPIAVFESLFEQFKEEQLAGKKRFDLSRLEEFLIAASGGVSGYAGAGGYQALYKLIRKKQEQGELAAIQSSEYNDRHPALRNRWRLERPEIENRWSDRLIFRLSGRLDLSYFLKRPQLQTDDLKQYLKKLYNFLGQREHRAWASREERSLELFGDEKFLSTSSGKKLLTRLKLTLADLKAEKYARMFVYWQLESEINKVLILENHSAFISCKRALDDGYTLLSLKPDTLIYGGGKHILKSLGFLEEIADPGQVEIYYAGDIDPTGLEIYTSLKSRYPDYCLGLFIDFYQEMIYRARRGEYALETKQNKDKEVLEKFVKELDEQKSGSLAFDIEGLWNSDLRVPQEVITYEVLQKESANRKIGK